MANIGRWALRLVALAALIFAGHEVIARVADWFDLAILPHTEDMLHRAILLAVGAYVLLMALPFVPGAEIGLTLLTALGGALAPLVYLATATSLMLAFLVGRLLPPTVLSAGLRAIGLRRAGQFVTETAKLSEEELKARLLAASQSRFASALVNYRYVALALAINTPGNVVLGGGCGLAMMAGLSRLFDPLSFLLTVLIAVLPVPLLFFLGQL